MAFYEKKLQWERVCIKKTGELAPVSLPSFYRYFSEYNNNTFQKINAKASTFHLLSCPPQPPRLELLSQSAIGFKHGMYFDEMFPSFKEDYQFGNPELLFAPFTQREESIFFQEIQFEFHFSASAASVPSKFFFFNSGTGLAKNSKSPWGNMDLAFFSSCSSVSPTGIEKAKSFTLRFRAQETFSFSMFSQIISYILNDFIGTIIRQKVLKRMKTTKQFTVLFRYKSVMGREKNPDNFYCQQACSYNFPSDFQHSAAAKDVENFFRDLWSLCFTEHIKKNQENFCKLISKVVSASQEEKKKTSEEGRKRQKISHGQEGLNALKLYNDLP